MAYTDFTVESAEAELGVRSGGGDVFPALQPAAVPPWLSDALARGAGQAWYSEKSRSEFIVAPMLLAVRELSGGAVTVVSGARLDVDPARRLTGECDFLLAQPTGLPIIRGPLVAVVEAKKLDIDAGLGQCIAQMVAASVFNDRAGTPRPAMYGCVTTGETWQFLRLAGPDVTLHQPRLYISHVGLILAAFGRAVAG